MAAYLQEGGGGVSNRGLLRIGLRNGSGFQLPIPKSWNLLGSENTIEVGALIA